VIGAMRETEKAAGVAAPGVGRSTRATRTLTTVVRDGHQELERIDPGLAVNHAALAERRTAEIIEVGTPTNLLDLREQLSAVETLAKKRRTYVHTVNRFVRCRIRVEWELGRWLASLNLRPGRGGVSLKMIGVTKRESMVWQTLHGVDLSELENEMTPVINTGHDLTARAVYAWATARTRPPADEEETVEQVEEEEYPWPAAGTVEVRLSLRVYAHCRDSVASAGVAIQDHLEALLDLYQEHKAGEVGYRVTDVVLADEPALVALRDQSPGCAAVESVEMADEPRGNR
jgi:hypothetical protein